MNRRRPGRPHRRGAVAPLAAILLVPLLGMVAFAVDSGWMVLARSDLQNAADAAALAGAQQLTGQQQLNSTSGLYNLVNGLENSLHISSIDCTLELARIYGGIEFPETPAS